MNIIDSVKPAYWALRSSYRLMTNRIRLLPDFIIIGTQRGGTTSLYYYLTEHPGIIPALDKEIHFFDVHYRQGLRWYRSQFPTSLHKYYAEHIQKHHFITGESSPYYMFHPLLPKRLAAVMPQVKLIVLLRNPVDRAYSHYWLVTQEGKEPLPFTEAIQREEERLAGEQEKLLTIENYQGLNHRRYSYLARGIYVDQLKMWMERFPQEQFLILKSEDLYERPAEIVKQTLAFLDVPGSEIHTGNKEFKRKVYLQYREPGPKGYKNNQKPPKLDPGMRKYLVEYFKPHNARLYEFLGRDFGWDK